MKGRGHTIRTMKSLVADLRIMRKLFTLTLALVLASVAAVVMAADISHKVAAQTSLASRAYALRIYDDNWNSDINRTELVSFDVDNPNGLTVEHIFDGKKARAAAYIDGTYYMMESDDGMVAYRFSSYNTSTKEYKVIKEYRLADLENALMFQCMTYDATTDQIFAYAFNIRGSQNDGEDLDVPFQLFTIDRTTGAATLVGENTLKQIVTLAADNNGYLYGLDTEGTLWGVNKRTGGLSGEEGYAPLQPTNLQSMAFDTKSNELYWAGFTEADNKGNGFFGKFKFSDDEGWMYSKIADFTGKSEMIGLWIDSDPLPKGVPAAVSSLAMHPAAEGALSATLSWTNPQYDNGGNALSGTLTVNVYADGSLVKTVDHAVPGQTSSVMVSVPESGVRSYTVAAANGEGEGRTAYVEGFVGRDTPGTVNALMLTKDSDHQLTAVWNAPAEGAHGGWFDTSTLRYDVVRLPDNVKVAEDIASTSYTDGNISKMAGYSYSIVPKNADGEGMPKESTSEFAGDPIEMPFVCDFSTDELVRLWKTYDADADGQTWYAAKNRVESFMKYFPDQELSPKLTSDDWIISAPMRFEAGKTYSLQYWARSQGELFPSDYNVTIGSS